MQTITSVMLESARKGYWKASPEQLEQTLVLHTNNIRQHGAACTEVVCDNQKLQGFISKNLSSEKNAEYKKGMSKALEGGQEVQDGVVLKKETSYGADQPLEENKNTIIIVAVVLLAFLGLLVMLRKKRKNQK